MYGANCQEVNDAWLRFLFFEVAVTGENSAQVAIEATRFLDILASFPNIHYIIGDAAYLLSSKVITPFTGSQRNAVLNVSFNFRLSQVQIRIEMAFGRVVAKWRILRSPLVCSLSKI